MESTIMYASREQLSWLLIKSNTLPKLQYTNAAPSQSWTKSYRAPVACLALVVRSHFDDERGSLHMVKFIVLRSSKLALHLSQSMGLTAKASTHAHASESVQYSRTRNMKGSNFSTE
jgi:hypothetical protein